MEDITSCTVAPGLPRPRHPVDWLICSPILGLLKNLRSLDWLLPMACAKGPQTLKNTKNFQFSFRAASTLEQF